MAASWANPESVHKSAPTQKGCPEVIEACGGKMLRLSRESNHADLF